MSQLVESFVRSQRLTLAFRFNRWLVNPKMMSASTKNVPKSIRPGFCLSDPDDPLEFCKSIVQLWIYFLAQFTENVEKSSQRSWVPSHFTDGSLWFQRSVMVLSRGSLSGTSNCWLIYIVRFLFQIRLLAAYKIIHPNCDTLKARKIPIQSINDPCAPGIHPCGTGCPRLVLSTLQV